MLIILVAADLEAEDIDLGNAFKDDLAVDVDGYLNEIEEDPEALDSDDEGQLEEELELDDNSECAYQLYL